MPTINTTVRALGNVYTRPSTQRLFATSFGGIGVTYQKSFVQPNGDPLNLVLTSDGEMHQQDVNNSPSTTTEVFSVIPGVYASSVTQFGREYFAFHDGTNAKDIPRQYDGTNWYRVSQDGPAGTLGATDAPTTTIPINTIVPKPAVNISTMTLGIGFITVVTTAPHGLAVADNILITGNTIYQYNGPEIVATVPNPTSFTYNSGITGLMQGTGGQVIPDTVTCTTTVVHGLISGETITIAGNSDSNYNNSTGQVNETVGLASSIVVNTYAYNDSNGGAFNYTYPHQGYNEPLPGPLQTVVLSGSNSLMWNPNGPLAGTNLPGAPSENNPPLQSFGVTSTNTWDSTATPVSSSNFDFALTVTFNIAVSVAGTVTFQIVHKEGTILGIGGGATYVSGELNDPQPGPPPVRSGTAKNNYPIMYMNNGSTEYYHVSIFNQQHSVNFPAAGIYPVEINYVQWHHSNPVLVWMWQNSVPQFVPFQPGAVAFATPATWTVKEVTGTETFTFDAVYAVGTGTGGTITVGGLIAPGPHQVCVSFMTQTDFITKPSPPVTWNSAGNKRVQITNLPIGPPNTIARVVHFTGAGVVGAAAGANFFYLPVPAIDPATGQQVSTSTVVNDNTTTTATFDFGDNSLFEGISIDQTGNDLFGLVTLGPCANIFAYSNRIFVHGDTNKIQNLLNMGFEGGTAMVGGTQPLGWTPSAGGQLVAGEFGYAWQITGNGTNTSMGMITQPAFQDYRFTPILSPNTSYTFELFAFSSVANQTGSIIAELYSATGGGVLANATIAANTLGVGLANGRFVQMDFSAMTPATIPADTLLRIYGQTLGNGQYVVLDEMMMVYTAEPVTPGQARASYQNNPESFHGVTGIYDVEYPETIYTQRIIRDNLYTVSAQHLSRTQDNGVGEPVTWTNYTVSDKAGGFALRGFDTAEGWGVFASEQGLMMFSGGPVVKISQEIQTLWDSISPSLRGNLWLKIDPQTKRIYMGVPLTAYAPTDNTFTPQSCNKILVMDYRELNTASAVENAPPLHISMTGRMLSSDLTRKWTVWNLPMNSGETLYLPNQEPSMTFGSGLGNGLATGYGNVYSLDENLVSAVDQDYGVIGSLNGESTLTFNQWIKAGRQGTWRPRNAYYITYLAPSHEQEQQLQIGSQRKLYIYLEAYCPGVGNLYVVPLLDQIENPTNRPPKYRVMVDEPNYDFEWPLNHRTQRMALMFYATPLGVAPGITITPMTVSVSTNNTQLFTYILVGTPTQDVTWSVQEPTGGTVSTSGLYTAPSLAGTYHVQVTSVDSPSTYAVATVTVTGGYDGA